ncbi:MAG: sugar transferase, partial [Candidatus Thiodiazotropha sp.]
MAIFTQHNAVPLPAQTDFGLRELASNGMDAGAYCRIENAPTADTWAYGTGHRNETLRGGGKRLFDLILALALLILSGPILGVAMLALWLSTLGREPVIYRQTRIGLN